MTPLRLHASLALTAPLLVLLCACEAPYTQRPEDAAFYSTSEASASQARASDRAQAEIGRLWREHIEAAQEKDLAGVLAIYDADIVYSVSGTELRGRAALDAHERQSLASGDVHPGVEHTTVALTAHGDVVYELGTIVGPVRVHGQATRVVRFPFMARWVRHDDQGWKLQHLVGDAEQE